MCIYIYITLYFTLYLYPSLSFSFTRNVNTLLLIFHICMITKCDASENLEPIYKCLRLSV